MTKRPRGRPPIPVWDAVAKHVELWPSQTRPSSEEIRALVHVPISEWPALLREEHWIWDGDRVRLQRHHIMPRFRRRRAALVIYEDLVGPVPEMHQLHRMRKGGDAAPCPSPFCVNPAHHVVWPKYLGPVQYHLIKEPEPLPEPEPEEEEEESVNPEMLDAGKFFSSKLPNMTIEEMAELYNEHPKYIETTIEMWRNHNDV